MIKKQTRARHQKGSLTKLKRKGGLEVWVFRWREIDHDGTRCPRKLVVGTVKEFPTVRAAWLAIERLNLNINRDLSCAARKPRTFAELAAHYEATEMAENSETLAYSTRQGYRNYLRRWLLPKFGPLTLEQIENMPGVHVEAWLKSLDMENGTKAKIRNLLSGICTHAMRWAWMKQHPIQGKVRQSQKSARKQVPLSAEELQALYAECGLRERAMLSLDVPSGLRRGEILALQWKDFDFKKKTMSIHQSIWHQHLGQVKTEASERVMPLDDLMIEDLLLWRAQSKYAKDEDWVFASNRMRGLQPVWPEGVMRNHIGRAAARAGITKRISWHTLRHTFSTLLLANGEDVKTAQTLMRHANARITMEIYTHAIDAKKRSAQSKVVQMVVPKGKVTRAATA